MMTRVLVIIVVVFIISYSPEFLLYEYFLADIPMDLPCKYVAYAKRAFVDGSISYLLMTINSSVNIIIYCFKDEQFRAIARSVIGLDRLKMRSTTDMPLESTTKASTLVEGELSTGVKSSPCIIKFSQVIVF